MNLYTPESKTVLSVKLLGLHGVGGGSETLEGTKSLLIKCTAKGGREQVLNWGFPVWNDDVFPPSAVSDKLISPADSEVLQPLSAGSRLLPSYTTGTH